MKKHTALLLVASFLWAGCSSKQYFEPKESHPVKSQATYAETIVSLGASGATLDNGHYIGEKGISPFTLGKGYRFLNESKKYVLASNIDGKLKIMQKKTGTLQKELDFKLPVIAASEHRGFIAYILNNNTFGVYDMQKNKKCIEEHSGETFAINTKAANPLFIDNLVMMPMLDGKLILFDIKNPTQKKTIYLSSEKVLNNVISLSRIGSTLMVATPKKLLTLGVKSEKGYKANIADVIPASKSVYVVTKEGSIVHLTMDLKPLKEQKFEYASFVASTMTKHQICLLDTQGSLIVLSKNLEKFKIYHVGEIASPVWMKNGKLYKDNKIIDLTTLSYE